jgi:Phage integrase, N-terminal SAM-like domain
MRGHIRERSPGHWAIVLDMRDPETGKRKRKWHSFRGTKRQAQIESTRLISELQGGGYLEPSKVTFVQFLRQWLGHIKSRVSPRTHERYTELVEKNIAPLLACIWQDFPRPK